MKKNGETSNASADRTAKKPRGRPFKKGQSGNPAGRPKGSVSIMTRVKQILRDEPDRLEEIARDLIKDKKLRVELIRQVDGMPKQSIEEKHSGDLTIIEKIYPPSGESTS